jgi:autotransporter-associated beta strand protein
MATGGTGAIQVNTSGTTLTLSGVIDGSGTLSKTGPGTLSLSGTNTYSGGTTIVDGSLNLSGAGSLLDAGKVNLTSATSSFNIAGITGSSETIGSVTGVTGSKVQLGAKTLILGDDVSYTFAGDIEGAGGNFQKSGTGTATLSGNNSYSGTTNLAGGTLLLGSSTALPANATLNLSSGTTLNTGGLTATTGQLNVNGNTIIDLSAGASSALTFASAGAWSGILSIWNYTGGAAWTASVGDKISFTSQGSINLANINFYSDSGSTMVGTGGAGFVGTELVPVPEPSAVLAGLLLVGAVGWRERRTIIHLRK